MFTIMQEETRETEKKIYEAAFHLVPNFTPEDIRAEYDAIKKFILDKEEAEFISEGLPTIKNLAYSLSKTVKAQKSTYTRAYFCWLKFAAYPDQVLEIKTELDERPTVIRHLIINTVRESTLVGKEEEKSEDESSKDEVETVDELESLDKTIDDLVVQ